ncbi:MAG: hypothetical protein DRG24_07890, partial [Epsilonproteobacteria bacterium]
MMNLKTMKTLALSSLLMMSSLNANEDLFDEDIEDILSIKSELKVEVGSRDGARNYLASNTPVDVITAEQIEHSGLTSLVDVLRYFVAGFNAPETSVADGSDHVRAYTLRGMSADQLLVLINGKRLHTSALLHVNGTIGRGSSHVDLDTVPVRSIERVEILRDGAAAQYGSDAISGVINIILKGIGHKSTVSVHGGQRKSGDGEQFQADTFISIPLDYDGFINITLDAKEQKQTQRAGADSRLSPPSVQTHAGIPDSTNYKALLFTEIPQANDITLYAQMLLNYRESEASAFFRPSSEDSTPLYPNGFLPMISAEIFDYSAVIGIKGRFSDTATWDFSNVLGQSHFHYYVNNSMNYSLGSSSPTSFDNGTLDFFQNTATLDLQKRFQDVKIAGGIEYRYENYAIEAGDISSYSGTASQGFAGYHPDNAVDEHRDSFAIYVDSTYQFSEDFLFEVALRYEDYSDFGDSTNGKLALSYYLLPELMFRSSASTGFRAPSLAQSHYSQTSSFVDTTGVLRTQGTFRIDHEISKSLNAQALKSEKSNHFTLGTVYQPSANSSFSIDYFYIKVDDKIMLTPDLTATTQEQQEVYTKYGVSAARFFTNAATTHTQGVDIKLNYNYLFSHNSNLDFGIWYNYNVNEINKKDQSIVERENKVIKTLIENGQPKDSL